MLEALVVGDIEKSETRLSCTNYHDYHDYHTIISNGSITMNIITILALAL